MFHFLELTQTDGAPVLVNLSTVHTIRAGWPVPGTAIAWQDWVMPVRETYDEVNALIAGIAEELGMPFAPGSGDG